MNHVLTAGAARPVGSSLPLIELEGVSVTYPDAAQPALMSVDLTLYAGETVLLLGPSGAGKSTLISLCSGLIPESIEAAVTGRLRRDAVLAEPGSIGFVFQDPEAQFYTNQARDELAFGLENRGVPRDEMPQRMLKALDQIRFWPHPETKHAALSGGQKQKLAIAAALVMAPKLLILDEPTSNLDPAAAATVVEQIRDLRAAGQAMLIVEHQFTQLLDVVDRIVLLSEEGTVVATGSPDVVITEHGEWMMAHGVLQGTTMDRQQRVTLDGASGCAAAFQVTDGAVRYGRRTVLDGLQVDIPAGSFTAIVGPNGVGKSTLLQVLGGLLPLAGGQVRVFGEPAARRWHRKLRERISYCFQNPELQFMYERVGDELANRRVDGEVPAAISEELDRFGLGGTALQSPFSLSQGQKRRLSVAVMLHRDTDAYLLDEPTYGQDGQTQAAIMDMLTELQSAGKTIVITTHDMDLVQRFATHVIVLSQGTVAFQGHPNDLFVLRDLLRQAHLAPVPETDNRDERARALWLELPRKKIRRPVDALNPTLLALSMMTAGLIGTFAQHLAQAWVYLAISLVWLFGLRWLSPWRALKWFSPFVVIYLFYLWSFAAYSAVPPGEHSVHILWAHFTWQGLRTGLLVAIRMLSSVGYLILLLVSVEAGELMVGLCQNVKVPPKFAYGILTGMRLAPLFQEHWRQLTQARMLRGRLQRLPFLHVISYAIPLLSLAVRASERAAIAMEARGLIGDAANRPAGRTYLRDVPIRTRDLAVGVTAIVITIVVMAVVR